MLMFTKGPKTLAFVAVIGIGVLLAGVSGRAQPASERLSMVKAMTFDVFGTVVDWRSSLISEGQALSTRFGFEVDWAQFADEWRGGYGPAMQRVRSGELPWMRIDDLHRMILDTLIDDYGLAGLSENELADLNCVWHRLDPWPDSVGGLTRLKHGFTIATLSNGNVSVSYPPLTLPTRCRW